MCVLAVDSLMYSRRAIWATARPSASSWRTSRSRGESWGPVGVIRRRMAFARSVAVKLVGEEAACLAAATTSSAGASFATKADAPASSAPNSCSSPAYIVSTTMPASGSALRICRVASSPLPSGRRTSGTTTPGLRRAASATPSATLPASPTTSKSGSRSKARRRPWRISSWSSMRSTLVVTRSPPQPELRDTLALIADHHLYHRPLRVARRDLQAGAEPCCTLSHDLDPEAVLATLLQADPVVLHPQLRSRRVDE